MVIEGWVEIREFYGFEGDHRILFCYVVKDKSSELFVLKKFYRL